MTKKSASKKSKLVTNETSVIVQEKITNLKLTVNITKGLIRNDTMEGRDYIVVPMVMMVEGVLAANLGPLLYTAEEIEKLPGIWNHKPVVVSHPEINGQGVSACSPEIITKYKIGVIMNAHTEKNEAGKVVLKAEAWLEASRIEAVDSRIAEAIANETMLELSTGLFVEAEEAEGEFDGEKYVGIARNFRPDHLAILPDGIGASSRGDGAGFIRNALKLDVKVPDAVLEMVYRKATEMVEPYITVNAKHRLSNSNLEHQLFHLLEDELGSAVDFNSDNFIGFWIVDVFAVEEFVIFEFDGKFFKFDYNVDNEVVSLTGERVEVIRVTEFRTVDGAFVGNKTTNKKTIITMNKIKKIVDNLIANHGWDKTERDFLMGLAEDRLTKMVPVENIRELSKEELAKAVDVKIAANKEEEKAAELAKNKSEDKPITAEAYIANAPKDIQGMLSSGLATHNAQVTELVAAIIGNAKNTFTEDQLKAKSLEELTSIAKLAAVEVKPAANFAGNGDVNTPIISNEETPLETPLITFEQAS